MLIQSKIERPGGTKVTLQGTTYHFKPQGIDPEHVAYVLDENHVALLLAIPEGYAPLGAKALPDMAKEKTEPFSDSDQMGNEPVFGISPVTPPVDAGLDGGSDTIQANGTPIEEMTREALAAEYERLEGRKPHHNIKTETLIEKIEELRAAQ